MGHLYIVSLETLDLNNPYISVVGSIGKVDSSSRPLIEKTVADILSDAFCTRIGDYVFPWITKGRKTPNIGFKFYFKVTGAPIFVEKDNFPIKIPISTDYFEASSAISEIEALDLFRKDILWNAIGKKSLGRGKSITHQTPQEDKLLIRLLGQGKMKKMPNPVKIDKYETLYKLKTK
ncbi:MAG: hypothetical protein AB2L26_01690 [Ignavibacteria bacterium]